MFLYSLLGIINIFVSVTIGASFEQQMESHLLWKPTNGNDGKLHFVRNMCGWIFKYLIGISLRQNKDL